MKKVAKLVYTFTLLEALPAFAQLGLNERSDKPGGLPKGSLTDLIKSIANAILAIVGIVAVLFIIIGGVMYITSAGNPDNVAKAKNTILYGVIGLIVVLLSWAIVTFVLTNIK